MAVKKFLVGKGQAVKVFDKRVKVVAQDLPLADKAEVVDCRGVVMGRQAVHEFNEGLLSFADTDGIEETIH